MDINELISLLQRTVLLYAEVLAVVFAAAILGLVAGLMMQRSKHKRRVECTHEVWEEKYRSLEQTSLNDADNLEEQLQSIASEAKSLQNANRTLKETVKRNDINVQKSRAESIELNRRHTETQERLQRIIQQKDRELAELSNPQTNTALVEKSLPGTTSSNVAALTEVLEDDHYAEDTVAIFPPYVASESTAPSTLIQRLPRRHNVDINDTSEFSNQTDPTMDDTANMAGMGLDDSTIAMTDEARAYAIESFTQRTKDK